ncbi:peptidylprolyl isomerase [Phenylobacterium sp.]|uniref:peptidylprolyl isomerase n=1 Tax=Phenylobacterium sp. TaxID=1871053 RepID=UPI002C45E1A6|nr:SurA N-terminal domain-containing protein [Phenylobacterium sp.]HLZ76209.1 SurA N-terminal domain-containing protein [Phenylobacterium sp.]
MLANIRAFTNSWAAKVILGLVIVSFVVFGIGNRDLLHPKISNAVITAGPRSIGPAEYKRAFDNYIKQVEQQVHQEVTPQLAADNGLDQRVAQGMATSEAFAAYLTKIGIRPSDKLIAGEIQKIPAFFDQVSGRFDRNSYLRRLADNNLTAANFESQMRDQLSEQHAATGLITGLRVPRAYAAMGAIYTVESRDLGYFTIAPASVPQPPAPTDAQLTELMKENAAQLTRPEFRTLTVVKFSPTQVAANAPVDPKEVQKRFDFRKDTLSSPETRTVIQIPAKTPAAAVQIAQGLAKGTDAEAVAKAAGVEAITYANKPQSAIPDKKVAAAAFATPSGQVATVKGDLGVAVVKVMSVTPGRAVTLEEVRPAIEAEIRKDQASEKVYALTQAYDDAHQGGATLAAAAAKAGVPTTSIGPVSQGGRDLTGQPVQGLTQKLMETAWSLPAGGESEVEDAGNGEFFAVRVEKITPPAMPPLEEIRPMLAKAWTQRELGKALQAKADGYVARIKKGETLAAVAASAGSKVSEVPGIDRRNASQNQALGQDVLGKLFTSRPGDVFAAQDAQGFVVGKLEAVHGGDPTQLAQMVEQLRPQMTSGYLREIGESAHVYARQKIKVTIDSNRAREAIGLEPIDPKAQAAGGKTATGKPGKAPLAK